MASIISAGTTSGTSLNLSGDTSGVLQLATNGSTTAVTIDTSQRVGIGTSSPTSILEVTGGAGNEFRVTRGTNNFVISLSNNIGGDVYVGTSVASALLLQTSNTERMRIDTSGNVGIGSTSPLSKLEVVGGQFRVANTSTAAVCIISTDSTSTNGVTVESSYYGGAGYGPMKFNTGGSERMRIDSSGNVIVGATSNTYGGNLGLFSSGNTRLDIATTSSTAQQILSFGQNGTARWQIVSDLPATGSGVLDFVQPGSGSRMRIDTDGNILLNGTSSAGSNVKIQAYSASGNGAQGWIGSFTGGSGGGRANQNVGYMIGQSDLKMYADWDGSGNPRNKINVQAQSAGVQLTSGATSWSALSDERKKDIIEPITDAVNKVSTLRTVIGKYKNDEVTKRRAFLIAQDVQAVLPEAIVIEDEGKDTEQLFLAYTDVIPLLVASIKELKAELDATKAEVAALKGVN